MDLFYLDPDTDSPRRLRIQIRCTALINERVNTVRRKGGAEPSAPPLYTHLVLYNGFGLSCELLLPRLMMVAGIINHLNHTSLHYWRNSSYQTKEWEIKEVRSTLFILMSAEPKLLKKKRIIY